MLDWLSSPEDQLRSLDSLKNIKNNIKKYNFNSFVLMGMGGSSNGPRVFQAMLGSDFNNFHIIDTIHPAAIKKLEDKLDLAHTLFIVASKSGSTLEPQLLYKYFYSQLEALGVDEPARHFMAISDPITPLEQESQEQGFLPGPFGDPLIGGRYSALSAFGIMPALLMNIDAELLLKNAQTMAKRCRESELLNNPGAQLGVFLGSNAEEGRNELVFYFSDSLKPLGWWLEQLIAESLGKNNSGILPIIDSNTHINNKKTIVCYINLSGEKITHIHNNIPSFSLELENIYELGAEMFRWQIAVSIAGIILGLNPFDQPDVEKSKIQARAILDQMIKNPDQDFLATPKQKNEESAGLIIYKHSMSKFLAQARDKSYVALLSYLDETRTHGAYLEKLKMSLSNLLKKPVLIQQGPRYLHSTGQFFKGGSNEGCFFLLTGAYITNLPSVYPALGIKDIHLSQALGDARAMTEAGRHIIHIHFKDLSVGFQELLSLIKH